MENLNQQDKQALEAVAQACRAFKGSLDDHQVLQNALNHLRTRLEAATTPPATTE